MSKPVFLSVGYTEEEKVAKFKSAMQLLVTAMVYDQKQCSLALNFNPWAS